MAIKEWTKEENWYKKDKTFTVDELKKMIEELE